MDRAEFEQMPALITRKAFMRVTGLNARDLYEMAKSGELKVFARPWRPARNGARKRPNWMYFKSEAARFCGWAK